LFPEDSRGGAEAKLLFQTNIWHLYIGAGVHGALLKMRKKVIFAIKTANITPKNDIETSLFGAVYNIPLSAEHRKPPLGLLKKNS
jgi:hypothetical protein